MPLTVAEVRNAKPGDSPYKLSDGGGLFLFVTPTGGKSWRLKYRFAGKERLLTFGMFPDVTLGEAREKRETARALLRADVDPGVHKLRARASIKAEAGNAFADYARHWHEQEKPRWSPGQARLVLRALERDIFPALGKLPIAAIDHAMLLVALRQIEARGAVETAKRVRGYVSAVFAKAKLERLVRENPASDLGGALRPAIKNVKQPALLTAPALIQLQRTVDASGSGPTVKLASRLLAFTVVRIGVLRAATWSELSGIDWDADGPSPAALWRIPADRMKLDMDDKGDAAFDHDVPLGPDAVEALRALRVLTGRGPLLFPNGRRSRDPMSDSALSTLYKRMDGGSYRGRHVPHGWRAAFSSLMNEWAVEHGREGDRLIIDLMLAHRPNGMSGSEFAYNRARYAKRRRQLAEIWAGMIAPGLVEPFSLLGGQER